MKLSDCYRILNVSSTLDWKEVKKSYHGLVKKYHPDYNPENKYYETRIKELNLAYQTLEAHYKSKCEGKEAEERNKSEKYHDAFSEDSEFVDPPEDESFQDSASGFKASWRARLVKILRECERQVFLLDIQKDFFVEPEMAQKGGTVRIRKGKDKIYLKIPSGSWSRMTLRVPGKGQTSIFGKKRGDLLLNIQVVRAKPVDSGESIFYYDMKVPTERIKKSRVLTLKSVHGPIKFILPKSTRNKQTFILKSKSSYDPHSEANHVVTVRLI